MTHLEEYVRALDRGSVEEASENTAYQSAPVHYWRSLSEQGRRFHVRLAHVVAKEMSKQGEELLGLIGMRASRGLQKKLLAQGFTEQEAQQIGFFATWIMGSRALDDLDPRLDYAESQRRVAMVVNNPKLREEYLDMRRRAFDYSPNPKEHYLAESFGRKLAREGHPSMQGLSPLRLHELSNDIGAAFARIAGTRFEPTLAQSAKMQKTIYGVVQGVNKKLGRRMVRLAGEEKLPKRGKMRH